MNEFEKNKKFEELFASTKVNTQYGWPLKFMRRVVWPFINPGLFYIMHQIFEVNRRIEQLEKNTLLSAGMPQGNDIWKQRLLTLNTDYIALKRAYFDILDKYEKLEEHIKNRSK